MAENLPGCPKARIILQQCLSGKLQVRPSSENTPAEYVEVSAYNFCNQPPRAGTTRSVNLFVVLLSVCIM